MIFPDILYLSNTKIGSYFLNNPQDLSSEAPAPFPLTSAKASAKSPYGRFFFKNLLENSHFS
jgi:hypothetical protein